MEYVSIKQISEKWGICARRVQTLCTEGRIEGAQRVGHQWIIPADSNHYQSDFGLRRILHAGH